jgi:hypothetical protein
MWSLYRTHRSIAWPLAEKEYETPFGVLLKNSKSFPLVFVVVLSLKLVLLVTLE